MVDSQTSISTIGWSADAICEGTNGVPIDREFEVDYGDCASLDLESSEVRGGYEKDYLIRDSSNSCVILYDNLL